MPDWIYRGEGYDGGKYDPDKFQVDLYAKFLADYLELMHDNGVRIDYLSPSKEWSQVITSEKASRVILLLRNECRRRKVPMPKIVGPASWSVNGGINDLKGIKELGHASLYAGFCTHRHNNSGSEKNVRKFAELAHSMGKRAFDDESSLGGGGRTHGEEPEFQKLLDSYSQRSAAYRAGLSGELFFENWSRGIDSETRSIYFKKGGVARRLRAHYVFLDFAASTKDGWYVPVELQKPDKNLETMAFWKGNRLTV